MQGQSPNVPGLLIHIRNVFEFLLEMVNFYLNREIETLKHNRSLARLDDVTPLWCGITLMFRWELKVSLAIIPVFVSLPAWHIWAETVDAFWQSQLHLSACCEWWRRFLPLRLHDNTWASNTPTPQKHFNGNKICLSAQSINVKELWLLKI